MKKAISGIFDNMANANQALRELENLGYTEADVSVITKKGSIDLNADASGTVKDAAAAGGLIGGVLGLLAGLGVYAIPGIGALFIAGPISAALGLTGAAAATASGAITGALVGGLLGALKEIGIDEVQAKVIEERIQQGDTLLLVHIAEDDESLEDVKDIMDENGGKHIYELDLAA